MAINSWIAYQNGQDETDKNVFRMFRLERGEHSMNVLNLSAQSEIIFTARRIRTKSKKRLSARVVDQKGRNALELGKRSSEFITFLHAEYFLDMTSFTDLTVTRSFPRYITFAVSARIPHFWYLNYTYARRRKNYTHTHTHTHSQCVVIDCWFFCKISKRV